MLGTSAKRTEYRDLQDFKKPADYLSYLYGSSRGLVYRVTLNPGYHHAPFRVDLIGKGRFAGVSNCYISMNTFYRTKGLQKKEGRTVDHVKRLTAVYVDIDCYKIGLSKEQVLAALESDEYCSKIPAPTFVIDSGRGIYLIWKLRDEDRNALPRWTAVQKYLVNALAELGADPACTDAARILRVPGSWNPKSESAVEILEFNDLTYSLYEIQKEYDIKAESAKKKGRRRSGNVWGHATAKQIKYVKDIAVKLGLQDDTYPDFNDFTATDAWIKAYEPAAFPYKGHCWKDGNTINLAEFKAMRGVLGHYAAEIRQLLISRKGEDCKREIGLFLYRYFLREMGRDSQTALAQTQLLNASLDAPFEQEYVATATASADRRVEKGIPYAYKKSTLIKILDITADELVQLPFLGSGSQNQKERQRAAGRKSYAKRRAAAGKQTKQAEVLERRAKIYQLQEQGLTAAQIQAELGVSKATYHRDAKALQDAAVMGAVLAFLNVEEIEKPAENAVSASECAKKRTCPGRFRRVQKGGVSKNRISIYRQHSFAMPPSVSWGGLSAFYAFIAAYSPFNSLLRSFPSVLPFPLLPSGSDP